MQVNAPHFSHVNPSDRRKGGTAFIPLTRATASSPYSLKFKGICEASDTSVGCATVQLEDMDGSIRKMSFRDQNPPSGSGRVRDASHFGRLGASVFAKNASGDRYMGATFWLNEDQIINITRLQRPMPGQFRMQFCVSGVDSEGKDLKEGLMHVKYDRLDKKHGLQVVRGMKSKTGRSCVVAEKEFFAADLLDLDHIYFRVTAVYSDGRKITLEHGLDWDGEELRNIAN